MAIITIDGPAGAGKSTAARGLAQRLGFEYLDTGATFRAVTLACLRAGVDVHDAATLQRLLDGLHIEMPPGLVLLNGEDITGLIRTQDISSRAGQLAENPVVRRWLVPLQRSLAMARNIICEGRDQGTVVFPDASCKFFLTADPLERARRRQLELAKRGETVALEAVLHAQEERDRRDASRDVAPMVPAHDAVLLDSTTLNLDQVITRMEQEVRRRQAPL